MSYRGLGTAESVPERSIGTPNCANMRGTERQACGDYEAGVRFFDNGQYAEAFQRFVAAYQRHPERGVLVAMGVSVFKLGRFEEAIGYWQRYVDDQTAPEERRRQVRGYIQNATRLLNPASPVVQEATRREAEETRVSGPAVAAPLRPLPNPYARRTTIGIWVATGAAVAGLVGLGLWLTRRAG